MIPGANGRKGREADAEEEEEEEGVAQREVAREGPKGTDETGGGWEWEMPSPWAWCFDGVRLALGEAGKRRRAGLEGGMALSGS